MSRHSRVGGLEVLRSSSARPSQGRCSPGRPPGAGRLAAAKRIRERRVFLLLGLLSLAALAPLAVILAYLVVGGLPALSWDFLTRGPSNMMRSGGIFPAIAGTFFLVVGSSLAAVPLGVAGGLYLAEYARPGLFTRLVRLAVANLAGVPSVVYGLFGLSLFVVFLRLGVSVTAGSLTLALLVLPTVIAATEEAARSVPVGLRHASLALGATRWATVRHVVLPGALPGILTGVILAVSRAAGETAPIMFTAAAFFLPRLPSSPFEPVMALPYHLYVLSTEVARADPAVRLGTALVLVLLVLGLNLVALTLRARLRARRRGEVV
ncbi:MAG: phosphate ABC transporter permease PstA [Firmicutes bacterium]|nr:phosphate ABC transporter permease PstA [Bacillota bacterium]